MTDRKGAAAGLTHNINNQKGVHENEIHKEMVTTTKENNIQGKITKLNRDSKKTHKETRPGWADAVMRL